MIGQSWFSKGTLTGLLVIASGAMGGITYAAEGSTPEPSAPSDAKAFAPPAEAAMPTNEFGKSIKLGEQIFTHTQEFAGKYVGNSLNCASCHLDAGRKPNSSPLWAAYLVYPAYRGKNGRVNSFAERLQGCFRYSMNGKAPPLGDPVLVAL